MRPLPAILAELETRDLLVDFQRIAAAHHVTIGDIFGKRRYYAMAAARHECWRMLRDQGWSLLRLAEFFSVDHTTIRAGIESHDARLAKTMLADIRRSG